MNMQIVSLRLLGLRKVPIRFWLLRKILSWQTSNVIHAPTSYILCHNLAVFGGIEILSRATAIASLSMPNPWFWSLAFNRVRSPVGSISPVRLSRWTKIFLSGAPLIISLWKLHDSLWNWAKAAACDMNMLERVWVQLQFDAGFEWEHATR